MMNQTKAVAAEIQKKREAQGWSAREPGQAGERMGGHSVMAQAAYQRMRVNPVLFRPADVIALQRTVGNRQVQRMVRQRPVSTRVRSGLVQLSPLSDQLRQVWTSEGKGPFFERLRHLSANDRADSDLRTFVSTLVGDDRWLAQNLLTHGPEAQWPIHLRVEREMKGWGDSGGKGAVFDILRTANGAEAGNAQLTASLSRVFGTGTDDLWLARNLQAYGREAQWPIHLRVEREMKGWSDSGGKNAVFAILRAANGSDGGNVALTTTLNRIFAANAYERWFARNLQQHGSETGWSMKLGIMNVLFSRGDQHIVETIINQNYRVYTFATAFDKWRYNNGVIAEVPITGLLGNTDRANQIIRLYENLSHQEAASTLFHEVGHVTSTEPDYLEQEIAVRITTEEFRIRHGMPETQPGYRNPDGTVNVTAIRNSVMGSSHYNPTGRTRIGRRYEGDRDLGAWTLP